VSADTIVPGPSNPQTLNRYSYVQNNPTGRIDPTGHYDVVPGDDPYWNNTGSGGTQNYVYLPIISNQSPPTLSRYPSAAFPRKPVPVVPQPTSWLDTARRVTPVAKAATKDLWDCLFGSCALSIADWTGSIDIGGLAAPVGVAGRITGSVAMDSQSGLGLVFTLGAGGSTPTVAGGIGATFTNAPDVNKLAGDSVQIGGSVAAGIGVFAEGVFFKDSDTDHQYYELSVSGVGAFPNLIPGSIHATVERSWVTSVNLIDLFFYPVEQLLAED